MLKSIINALFKISRTTGKVASTILDVKTLASGDPNKIARRVTRKGVSKIARKINKKI